jgi:predicted enzyme related to lactoylglutathione lyase
MTNIDKHPAGSFCWIELATSDQAAAKNFYGSIFGWTPNDMPMGPSDVYTIFKIDDRDAGAAYTLRPDQRAQHVPPHWMLYILVESADSSAAKATQLGGKVIAGPFDVMDFGRMAVIQDPTGAYFCLWQAKQNTGNGIAGRPRNALLGRSEYTRREDCGGILLRPVRMAIHARRKRYVRLPAHQERRTLHRRRSARRLSPARSASALACLFSGR